MFDPDDFARLATSLVQTPCGAAHSRTSISRAYYSTFLTAKTLLDPYFHLGKTAEVHTVVQMLLSNSTSNIARELGRTLDDLRSMRNDADYDLRNGDVDSYHTARLQNKIAARATLDLRLLLDGSSTASGLIDEMKQWARRSGKARVK